MRLRTKLVLTASMLTFAIVLVLAVVFLGELLQQRVDTTALDNEVLAQEVLLSTRQALEPLQQATLQMKPGQTALTRTPNVLASARSAAESATTPAFVTS